jgi:hypothetical protein
MYNTALPDEINILEPKIQLWIHFEGPWNGKCWYILRAIWYIL